MIKKFRKKRNRGFILIAVLLVISVLVAIIVEFNYESRMKFHLSDNFCNASKALNYAEAGVSIAIASLKKNADILSDKRFIPLFSGGVQIPIEEGYCTIVISDESGKININTFKTSDDKIVRHRVDQMLKLIDLLNYKQVSCPVSYSLIPAIIDWVDYDDEVTYLPFIERDNKGAENNYYMKLVEPYKCKNAHFETLNELLLVKGMTTVIFDGRSGDNNKDIEFVEGIRSYLTIYGDGKININEAPPTVIRSLSDEMSSSLVQNIIEQRNIRNFESVGQLRNVPGMTSEVYESIRELITVKPENRYYNVTVTGVAGDFQRKIRIILKNDSRAARIVPILRKEL
ncbi:MAG: general secretion pathway protein GspK [Sedimentisphaerales bacterium]|nr:general secretion pathway protein GspK [Sedimentisphaerales bacterium]